MKLITAFRLGRVSNLPTIFSNVLVGSLLTGQALNLGLFFILLLALSLVYTGGMFLNDAFDVDYDRVNQPNRPICQGEVKRKEVFVLGFILITLANFLIALYASNLYVVLAMFILSLLVVFYNWYHKSNSWSAYVMAICRALIYIVSGLMMSDVWTIEQSYVAVVLALWVIGLTSFAKGLVLRNYIFFLFISISLLFVYTIDINPIILLSIMMVVVMLVFWHLNQYQKYERGITSLLIADISLLDTWVVLCISMEAYAFFTLSAFGLTRYLQKYISGD